MVNDEGVTIGPEISFEYHKKFGLAKGWVGQQVSSPKQRFAPTQYVRWNKERVGSFKPAQSF